MREETHELASILNKQNEVLQSVSGYSKEKREAVISGDIAKIERLTRLETEGMESLGQLESARVDCARALARALGMEDGSTLDALCERMDAEERGSLSRLQGRLKKTIENQMQLNRINEKLIELQLRQIRFMLNTLTQFPAGMYTEKGTMDEQPGKKIGVVDFSV